MFGRVGGNRRRVVWGLVGVAVALAVWMVFLGLTLKSHARVRHWDTAWIGLDAMEVVGLLLTGLLIWHRRAAAGPIAAVTATLFAVDAWFDVTTAAKGTDHLEAVAMAAVCELPLAIGLATITVLAPRWQDGHRPSSMSPEASTGKGLNRWAEGTETTAPRTTAPSK
ncbi:hypothetical protein GCM10010211_32540 [Streptomyces albospinus]|uniref:Integral membrane protein n=1 Tax=Streptomyces albospinus TaxID=285515 RepID=A0ABQ2V2B0_9ACTN|nr:hypothetical protein [Streptomyces albospinus]GGU64929.1 hypothetical protein GCM10010211_32540 [Streptomyces albospinus]